MSCKLQRCQEEAQLLAISFNALCLLHHAPPPITLHNLRPGADFYGRGKDVLDLPLVTPEEVKQALQSGNAAPSRHEGSILHSILKKEDPPCGSSPQGRHKY